MNLTFQDFLKMEEIDHQYFPDENIAPAQESYKWYLKDTNSCIVVKEKDEVIAYISVLSLKKESYDKVKNNIINESTLTKNDLELDFKKYYNYLYFSAIAIDKDHRDISTLKKLLNATLKSIVNVLNQGHELKEVMTDCSTKEGTKITQKILKLKPYKRTSHNSTIHVLNGKEFTKYLSKHRI